MKKKSIYLAVFLLISFPAFTFAQAWSQGKGKGYFKISENIISSSNYFAPDGSEVKITTIGQYATGIYGEFGFNKTITGIVNFPIFVSQTLNEIKFRQSERTIPGDQLSGIGDADLGLKFGFSQKKSVVFSGSIILGLPFGKSTGGKSGILQTGDGEFNQLLRFDVSRSFYPKPIYISAYSGFNNRTEDFSDEVRYGFELGFPFKKFTPILKVNGIASLKNGLAANSQGSLFANNVEFLSPTLDLNYQFNNKIGISAAAATAVFGKNVLSGVNYNFGVFMKW